MLSVKQLIKWNYFIINYILVSLIFKTQICFIFWIEHYETCTKVTNIISWKQWVSSLWHSKSACSSSQIAPEAEISHWSPF